MINSAAVKFDQIGQEDDVEMAEGTEETRFGSLAATLNYITVQQRGGDFGLQEPGQVGREIRCEEDVHEDGRSDTRKRLKKACMCLKGMEKVMWAMTVWERNEETLVDVHVGSGWAEPPEREINERRHEDDDDQRNGAHTVVEDASFASAADSGSQILCGGYGDGGWSRGAFNNGELGLLTGQSMDGFPCRESKRVKERPRNDRHIEVFMVAGDDVRKSTHTYTSSTRRTEPGGG